MQPMAETRRRGKWWKIAGALVFALVLGAWLVARIGSADAEYQFIDDLGPRATGVRYYPPTAGTAGHVNTSWVFSSSKHAQLVKAIKDSAKGNIRVIGLDEGSISVAKADLSFILGAHRVTTSRWHFTSYSGRVGIQPGEWIVNARRNESWIEQKVHAVKRFLHVEPEGAISLTEP